MEIPSWQALVVHLPELRKTCALCRHHSSPHGAWSDASCFAWRFPAVHVLIAAAGGARLLQKLQTGENPKQFRHLGHLMF